MKLAKKRLQKIQKAARKLKASAPDNAIFEAARLLEDGARKLRIALATPMRPISLRDPGIAAVELNGARVEFKN